MDDVEKILGFKILLKIDINFKEYKFIITFNGFIIKIGIKVRYIVPEFLLG